MSADDGLDADALIPISRRRKLHYYRSTLT